MGAAKRRSPGRMPSDQDADGAGRLLDVPFILAGSRAERLSREPEVALHGNYRVRGGTLAAVAGRHVILFVHGYNVSPAESVASTVQFFGDIQSAFRRDDVNLEEYAFVGFTWPGDTGAVHFDVAQRFAHTSGVALARLVRVLKEAHGVDRISLVTHSLGAHVGLRSAAILGERRYHGRNWGRYVNVLLMGPAVENDVFVNAEHDDEYHFPDAAFAMRRLHMFCSRGDDVLKYAFLVNERDRALGYAGPASMAPLRSLARRVREVLGDDESFRFELHDFSPRSATVIDPQLCVDAHGGYWGKPEQADYYINYLHHDA